MTRIVLAAAAVIAAMIATLTFDPVPAAAREAPWCAVVSMGRGSVHWDCQYNSIEECVPNVISGNRGTCNRNPYYEGSYSPAKARKKRHAKRH